MNTTICIVASVIIIFLSVYILRYTLQIRSKSWNKGEREVNSILVQIANAVGGMEFINILLECGEFTSQIDNMVLTRKALYVIETKDYSGWIYGSQKNTYWTQVFTHYKAKTSGNSYTKTGVSKYRFYNPIKQNSTHINMLDKLLNIKKLIPVFNIVVFGMNSTLKDVTHSEDVYVILMNDLYVLIKNIDMSLSKELQPLEQARIVDAILYLNVEDVEKRKNHIRKIDSKYNK